MSAWDEPSGGPRNSDGRIYVVLGVLLLALYATMTVTKTISANWASGNVNYSLALAGQNGEVEENLIYFPGFRDVFDGHSLWSDDRLFETKNTLQPYPFIPKAIGAAALFVSLGNNDLAIILLKLIPCLSFAFLYSIFRLFSVEEHFSFLFAIFILTDDNVARFSSPSITYLFFIASLYLLLKYNILSGSFLSYLIGLFLGLNIWVYFGNFFVISILFAGILLPHLLAKWQTSKARDIALPIFGYVSAVGLYLGVLYLSLADLPQDYFDKILQNKNYAILKPYGVTITFGKLATALIVLAHLLAIVCIWLSRSPRTRFPRGTSTAGERPEQAISGKLPHLLHRGLPLCLMSVIASVDFPWILQHVRWVNIPQPISIVQRVGICQLLLVICLASFLIVRAIGSVTVVRLLDHIVTRILCVLCGTLYMILGQTPYARLGQMPYNEVAISTFNVSEKQSSIISRLKDARYPCVVSSSDLVLVNLALIETKCDVLVPYVLNSPISIEDAVDRFVASYVIEDLPLSVLLAHFHLSEAAPDTIWPICNFSASKAWNGEQFSRYNFLELSHHYASCNPSRLVAHIRRRYEEFRAEPRLVLDKYRIDFIYSPQNRILDKIRIDFEEIGHEGLFFRAADLPRISGPFVNRGNGSRNQRAHEEEPIHRGTEGRDPS